jgi:hypothetical protein
MEILTWISWFQIISGTNESQIEIETMKTELEKPGDFICAHRLLIWALQLMDPSGGSIPLQGEEGRKQPWDTVKRVGDGGSLDWTPGGEKKDALEVG